jgi:hypothetical protein
MFCNENGLAAAAICLPQSSAATALFGVKPPHAESDTEANAQSRNCRLALFSGAVSPDG